MAKKIQISDDGGTTFVTLPGSTGDFGNEAEGADDTIFGQSYSSQEIGLVTWSVNSDGIFKGFAGYLAEIKQQGTSTSLTAESMTLVSGKTFSIDDATKEIWDRATLPTFEDGGVPIVEADVESVDYLFGRVTFVSTFTPSGAITIATGQFFPTVTIGKGNSYTLTMSADAVDNTTFDVAQANTGRRTFEAGLRTVAVELGGIFDATNNAKTDLTDRNELIIEIDPAGDGSSIARGFFKLMSTEQSGAVGALEEETLNFVLTVPDDEKIEFVFNWRHTNTTLNQAIQFAITSWLTELNTFDVRYLPTGVVGASPLEGITGCVVFTDISLSGGLSNMNVFAIEMAGTGAYTEV